MEAASPAPKTIKNYVLTLHMMWRQAKAWNYVTHDPFEGLVLPKGGRTKRLFFTEQEVKQIINAAAEPERTLYWLAAETGLRAGELFGLRAQRRQPREVGCHRTPGGLESPSPNSED
jgi:integrase